MPLPFLDIGLLFSGEMHSTTKQMVIKQDFPYMIGLNLIGDAVAGFILSDIGLKFGGEMYSIMMSRVLSSSERFVYVGIVACCQIS